MHDAQFPSQQRAFLQRLPFGLLTHGQQALPPAEIVINPNFPHFTVAASARVGIITPRIAGGT
ncbi:MAG: hypothetical protein ABUK11_08400 [Mariprofundaceae bacterium]